MKIKQVCEVTGLTDRAIRYYIEEGLAAPSFTENYTGRRAYDFTEADVSALSHVATLRKFGFTVEEIRRILTDPQESVGIVAEVRARKEETLRQEGENLAALSRLAAEKAYTVAELAEELAAPVRTAEVPREDRWVSWRERFISWLKATPVWVVMLAPVLFAFSALADMAFDMRFLTPYMPLFSGRGLLLLALGLLPTLLLGAMQIVRRFFLIRRETQVLAAACCLVYMLPFGFMMLVFSLWGVSDSVCSRTEDIAHYMQVDEIFDMGTAEGWELFPQTAHTDDAQYYYFATYDGACELYAEWALPPEELEAEYARAEALLGGKEGFIRMEKGGFECLILPAWVHRAGGKALPDGLPFQPAADPFGSHSLTMFACNRETGAVRYISCEGRRLDGSVPHYMALDW